MSLAISHSPHISRQAGARLIETVYYTGVCAAAGALAAHAFHIVNPLGGAVFGATSALTEIVANTIAQRSGLNQTTDKIALWAVTFALRIGAGMLAAAAAGFTLTVTSAAGLAIAVLVAAVVVQIGVACVADLAGVNG